MIQDANYSVKFVLTFVCVAGLSRQPNTPLEAPLPQPGKFLTPDNSAVVS